MNPQEVLFVAGDGKRLASIKIRCLEIARRLGTQCLLDAKDPAQVPPGYKAYVCVKPDFGPEGAQALAKRAPVVWDILDDRVPTEGMLAYIASTSVAAAFFRHLGRIEIIPHYHCNIERAPSCGVPTKVSYVGSAHWYPQKELEGIPHNCHLVDRWRREEVAAAYKSTGVALNLRNLHPDFDQFLISKSHVRPIAELHVQLNSGIKLINCLGFGIPSISAVEPAYREIAPDCTCFSDFADCGASVKRLQSDQDFYEKMRARCLELAPAFHVDEIVGKYRQLFARL